MIDSLLRCQRENTELYIAYSSAEFWLERLNEYSMATDEFGLKMKKDIETISDKANMTVLRLLYKRLGGLQCSD